MKIAPTATALAILSLAAFALQSAASAEPSASRVIDRSFNCSVGVKARVRSIEVHGQSGTRLFGDPRKWKIRASTSVRDRSTVGPPFSIAWLVAGWPQEWEAGRTPSTTSLGLSRRCRPTAAIPLSRTELTGGSSSSLDDEYHCVVPRTILVRVKGVFRSPTALRFERRWVQLTAKGVLKEGQLAVRTPSGTPVVYAKVLESGKSSLFVGKTCEPDLISTDG